MFEITSKTPQSSATIRELADIADKVSEPHAQPLSVASIGNKLGPKKQEDNASLLSVDVHA